MNIHQNALGSRIRSQRRSSIATLFAVLLPCLSVSAQPGTLDAKGIGQEVERTPRPRSTV